MRGTAKSKGCFSSGIGEMGIAWKTRGEKQRRRVATSTTRPTAGVAWDLAPDAGVRVALCGITVVDGSELWRPRPGVPQFASSWAAQREPVRWFWSGGGGFGKWWDSEAEEEARRALEARGQLVAHYHHSLVPLADRTVWEGAVDASHPHHEYSVPLLVLRNPGRVSEVAERLRQPEPPRIPDLIQAGERFIGVTIAVDQGDRSELMIASNSPFDAPAPHQLEPIKIPRDAV